MKLLVKDVAGKVIDFEVWVKSLSVEKQLFLMRLPEHIMSKFLNRLTVKEQEKIKVTISITEGNNISGLDFSGPEELINKIK